VGEGFDGLTGRSSDVHLQRVEQMKRRRGRRRRGAALVHHRTESAQLFVLLLLLDVDAADRAAFVGGQPLIDALDVEEVHAGQPAHILAVFELAQTDGALLRSVLVLGRAAQRAFVDVR